MFEASFHFFNLSNTIKFLGHENYLNCKNKTTKNWNCSKYQTHNCSATAITDKENFIETRGTLDHDISSEKFDARHLLKNIKELSEKNSLTVADDIAIQIALPTERTQGF